VLGLNRIYLVPEGCSPREGAYVRMPLEDLLAVTALESTRNSCVVIGEDLGTVPDGLRERLADWGIWSYRVMMFERRHDGAFQPPQHYPPNALVTFNTHDLPTFLGWQTHRDIDVKRSLGIDPGESVDDRTRAIHQLEAALREQEMNDAGLYAMVGYLARSPSRILCLSIDDLLTVCDQPNVPGTINEHPNWRRKLPALIEGWDHHIDADALRQAVGERNSVQT